MSGATNSPSVKTHLNSKGFKNVTFAHWAGSVL